MPLPQGFIEELKSRCDIANVISTYVDLKHAGSNLLGLCPFHSEKTPSFSVSPSKQMFYCFGCHTGGDVITFVMNAEHLDYMGAVQKLAESCGMTIPDDPNVDTSMIKKRERIYSLNTLAARWFHQQLHSLAGQPGLEYLRKRGLSDKTITKFGLGFAPDSWTAFTDYAVSQGFTKPELKEACLAGVSSKTGRYYDFFRNRVIFPVLDVRGRVVAFGGRVLDGGTPKYLNSAETPVYRKKGTLFALNFAKNTADKRLLLCEGYMDAVSIHQAGFTGAVAICGTSFTPEQARLLASCGNSVVIMCDTDTAGKDATMRALGLLDEAGIAARVLALPVGKDPDEFIRTNGADAFGALLDGAAGGSDYKLLQITSRYNLEDIQQRIACASEGCKMLAKLRNAVERDVYTVKLAELCHVQVNTLRDEITRLAKAEQKAAKARFEREEAQKIARVDNRPVPVPELRSARAEAELLGILLNYPDYIPTTRAHLAVEQFTQPFYQRLYATLLQLQEQGLSPGLTELGEWFSAEDMGQIVSLQIKREGMTNSPQILKEIIQVIVQDDAKRKQGNAPAETDDGLANYIQNIKNQSN